MEFGMRAEARQGYKDECQKQKMYQEIKPAFFMGIPQAQHHCSHCHCIDCSAVYLSVYHSNVHKFQL
jgi:hypothetical protein